MILAIISKRKILIMTFSNFISCHRTEDTDSLSIIAAFSLEFEDEMAGKLKFFSISPEASVMTSTVNGNGLLDGDVTLSLICILGVVKVGHSGFDLIQFSTSLC